MSVHNVQNPMHVKANSPIDFESDERFRGYLEFINYNKRMSIFIPIISFLSIFSIFYLFMYFLPALHIYLFKPEEYEKLKAINESHPNFLLDLLFPLPFISYFAIQIIVIIFFGMAYYIYISFKDLRKGLKRPKGLLLTKDIGGEVYRVIENMALTLGIPVPRVYLLDTSARNALTLGFTPKDSQLLITRGLLESLNRPEFEAVIAHAFSNIRLYNTPFLTLMQSFFGALLDDLVKQFRMTETQAHILAAIMMGLTIYGFIAEPNLLWMGAPFMLSFAIVAPYAWLRKKIIFHRTQLADSLALEVTKDPLAYISALKKTAGQDGLTIRNASMLDSLKFSGSSEGVLASHPPLSERISAILETWRLRAATPLPAGMPELEMDRGAVNRGRTVPSNDYVVDVGLRTFAELQGVRDHKPISPYASGALMLVIVLLPFLFL